jgi:molybdopterin-guanine dinucleotide biosynthesis protein
MKEKTFSPAWGRAILQTATTTSTAYAIDANERDSLVVTNAGAEIVYVRTGDSTVTATAADYLLLSLTQISLTKFKDHTHIALLSATSTSAVHVIPGEGF